MVKQAPDQNARLVPGEVRSPQIAGAHCARSEPGEVSGAWEAKCSAITKKGWQCPIPADREISGEWFCHVHDPFGTYQRQLMISRKKKGRRKRERKTKAEEWWNKYHDYLDSEAWKTKRALVLNRDRHQCQGCCQKPATTIHHLTYDNVFNEPLYDLVSLCDECHEKAHHQKKDRRRS